MRLRSNSRSRSFRLVRVSPPYSFDRAALRTNVDSECVASASKRASRRLEPPAGAVVLFSVAMGHTMRRVSDEIAAWIMVLYGVGLLVKAIADTVSDMLGPL